MKMTATYNKTNRGQIQVDITPYKDRDDDPTAHLLYRLDIAVHTALDVPGVQSELVVLDTADGAREFVERLRANLRETLAEYRAVEVPADLIIENM